VHFVCANLYAMNYSKVSAAKAHVANMVTGSVASFENEEDGDGKGSIPALLPFDHFSFVYLFPSVTKERNFIPPSTGTSLHLYLIHNVIRI